VRLAGCLFILQILIIPSQDLLSQEFQFSREINPFTFTSATGHDLDMPFLGGYNVPRIQFIDIDSDGDLDLFLQEIDNQLSYFENIGSQNAFMFKWRSDDWLGFDHGAWFRYVDMDNDTHLEFLCQGVGTRIRYFENQNENFVIYTDSLKDVDGNLIFSELTSIPEFYDLDCDGDLDLFLGRQSGTITHYENLNSEQDSIPQFKFITDSFQDILIIGGATLNKPNHHGANSLSFGDLNNDQSAELVYGDFFSRSLYYFDNQGTCTETVLERTFDIYPQNDPLLTGGFNRPQLVDIDGDFDLDLFVTVLGGFFSFTQNVVENFYFYENTGTIESANFSKISSNFLEQIDVGEESVPSFVDIDSDGDLDLFIGNQSEPEVSSNRGQIIFCENIGDAMSPQFRLINEDYLVVENMYNFAPTFGDLDGDGDVDLLSGRNNGKIAYWKNTGDIQNPQYELIGAAHFDIDVGAISVPALVDLDMDNDLDLLIGEFSGNLNYYVNLGDSTNPIFELQDEFFADIQTGNYAKPSFADFDSDGDKDLIIGTGNGNILFYKNLSDGLNLRFEKVENLDISAQPKSAPVMADLKNKNQYDLLSGSQGGGLYYFENTSLSSIDNKQLSFPESFFVSASYPNPFNNRMVFNVTIPFKNRLKIEVYTIAGERINIVFNNEIGAGNYTFQWDGYSDNGFPASSGLYILNINFDSFSLSQKIILLK
jgi:hypothetical protein